MNLNEKRADMVAGLRRLADMLSDVNTPLPYDIKAEVFWQTTPSGHLGDRLTVDLAREVRGRNPGGWSKAYLGEIAEFTRNLSDTVTYTLNIRRRTICERVVVGKREIPARTEDIVEWRCGPGA